LAWLAQMQGACQNGGEGGGGMWRRMNAISSAGKVGGELHHAAGRVGCRITEVLRVCCARPEGQGHSAGIVGRRS